MGERPGETGAIEGFQSNLEDVAKKQSFFRKCSHIKNVLYVRLTI